MCDNSDSQGSSTGVIGSTGGVESSTGGGDESSSTGFPTGLGETGLVSSTGVATSSSAAVSSSAVSSSTGLVSSTGISSSTGLSSGGGGWENVPCTSVNGQLQATLFKAGWYVFVSIEKILQAVFATPCDIVAGLNRTIQWAEDFAIDCKTQFENRMTVVEHNTTDKGDVAQRHRDCGDDMGHFFSVVLDNIHVYAESTFNFKYTEDMLVQKGKCGTCGKNLRWAFFDEADSKWKYPAQPSQVDVNKKEVTCTTTQATSNWAVVYADALNGTSLNGTSSSSSGGHGFLSSSGINGENNAAGGLTTSFQVVASLASLVVMAVFY
jgi:hypothetical protein